MINNLSGAVNHHRPAIPGSPAIAAPDFPAPGNSPQAAFFLASCYNECMARTPIVTPQRSNRRKSKVIRLNFDERFRRQYRRIFTIFSFRNSPGGKKVRFLLQGGLGADEFQISFRAAEVIVEHGGRRGQLTALLKLLSRVSGKRMAAGSSPSPHLKFRGLSLDISRGAIPLLRTFRDLVPRLFLLGCTHLALYIEDTLENPELAKYFPRREVLLTRELQRIESLCELYGIELFIETQFLGHLEKVLRHQALRKYADPLDPACLDAANSEGKAFVDSFAMANIAAFKSGLAQIGFDETAKLPLQKVKARLRGVVRLLSGKRVGLWADQLLKFPELLEELPPDALLFNWNYFHEQAELFEHDAAKLSAFRQVLCPAVWSWLKFIPDYRRSFANITAAVQAAARSGLEGALLTVWGDGGNEAPLTYIYPLLEYFFGLCRDPRDARRLQKKILRKHPCLEALLGLDSALPFTHRYYLWEDPLRAPYSKFSGFDAVISNYRKFSCLLLRRNSRPADRFAQQLLLFLESKVRLSQMLHGGNDAAAPLREALENVAAGLRQLRLLYCESWLRLYKPAGLREQIAKFRALEKRLLYIRDGVVAPGKLAAVRRRLASACGEKPPQTGNWREIFRQ
jgi:hypothetical protein